MIVIDTDILIWILRGNKNIKSRFTDIVNETNGYVFITPIQIAEIYAGIREKEKIRTEKFLESLNTIAIGELLPAYAGSFSWA
jgi:predicted nucleic acid-binding protein